MPYVVYSPTLEKVSEDENETIQQLTDTMLSISHKTFEDSSHAMRSVHVKSNALLRGELVVPEGLPASLQQGLFSKPGRYQVAMRLSAPPGDILPDSVSTPRALALKVVGVEGERLEGSEDDRTQDFLMVNRPAFEVPDAKHFLGNLKKLAKTTDKAEGFKVFVASFFRGTEKLVESLGTESPTLRSMGGHPATNPLGETYYSQVPFRYGEHVAKFSLAPISPELTRLTDAPVDISDSETALRDAIVEHFRTHGGQWELRVQLCSNETTMPIEDASVAWPEDESPYVAVARVSFSTQSAWDVDRARAMDDNMAFNPWKGLAAHRPLGSVNRARKLAYEQSRNFRETRNGCPIRQPRSAADLP